MKFSKLMALMLLVSMPASGLFAMNKKHTASNLQKSNSARNLTAKPPVVTSGTLTHSDGSAASEPKKSKKFKKPKKSAEVKAQECEKNKNREQGRLVRRDESKERKREAEEKRLGQEEDAKQQEAGTPVNAAVEEVERPEADDNAVLEEPVDQTLNMQDLILAAEDLTASRIEQVLNGGTPAEVIVQEDPAIPGQNDSAGVDLQNQNELDLLMNGAPKEIKTANPDAVTEKSVVRKTFAQAVAANKYKVGAGALGVAAIAALNSKKGRELCTATSVKFNAAVNYLAKTLHIEPKTVKSLLGTGTVAGLLTIAYQVTDEQTKARIRTFITNNKAVLLAGGGAIGLTGAGLAYRNSRKPAEVAAKTAIEEIVISAPTDFVHAQGTSKEEIAAPVVDLATSPALSDVPAVATVVDIPELTFEQLVFYFIDSLTAAQLVMQGVDLSDMYTNPLVLDVTCKENAGNAALEAFIATLNDGQKSFLDQIFEKFNKDTNLL